MPRKDKLKGQLKRLLAQKRADLLALQPCPACGVRPTDGMQLVDQETGLDARTGEPVCDECGPLRGRIEFILPSSKPESWPDSPFWNRNDDDGPDTAA